MASLREIKVSEAGWGKKIKRLNFLLAQRLFFCLNFGNTITTAIFCASQPSPSIFYLRRFTFTLVFCSLFSVSFGTVALIARRLLVGFLKVTLSVLVLPVSHTFSSSDLFTVVRAVVCVFLCGPVMGRRTDGRTGLAMTEYGWMSGLRGVPLWMLIK